MTIIFIAGSASKDTKTAYIAALADRIPNSIYLNLNNINHVFSYPASSEFIQTYSYEQRILYPGHEAVLGIAQDNIPLHKVVILDGDFDYELTADYVAHKFPLLQESGMLAIYLHNSNDAAPISASFKSLTRLVQTQVLMLAEEADMQSNLSAILAFSKINSAGEKIRNGMLVMGAGVAGSAKTTHLKKTCLAITDSAYLDKDTVALKYLDIVGAGMPSPYYNIHVKSQSYEAIFQFAMDNIKLNKTALLDGCFGDRLTGSLISNHLANTKYLTTLMYFHCSGPTQRLNILERNVQRDTEKLKDLPEDRRNNLQKHLKDFSQIDPAATLLYLDTEHREDTDTNVEKIINYLLHSYLVSLKMNIRIVSYAETSCTITQEEAQGGLPEFLSLLERTVMNDQRMQQQALRQHVTKEYSPYLISTRNTIWRENSNLMINAGVANEHLALPTIWRA